MSLCGRIMQRTTVAAKPYLIHYQHSESLFLVGVRESLSGDDPWKDGSSSTLFQVWVFVETESIHLWVLHKHKTHQMHQVTASHVRIFGSGTIKMLYKSNFQGLVGIHDNFGTPTHDLPTHTQTHTHGDRKQVVPFRKSPSSILLRGSIQLRGLLRIIYISQPNPPRCFP